MSNCDSETPFANALAKGHDDFMSDQVPEPSPNDLADRAVAAAASALEMLKRFTVGEDASDVRGGIMPDFGPNLVYGVPDDVQEQIAGSL